MSVDLTKHREALLTAPRTSLDVSALPAEVRVYLKDFPDALEVEARRLLVQGVPYFELLRVHAFEEEDEGTFVTGTIVDGTASEVVELDFVEGHARFLPSAEEVERDERLSRFAGKHFSRARVENGPFEATLPPAVDQEADAKAHRFEFEGQTYFAQSYREAGQWEVLIYDAKGRSLGGTYALGNEPFELAEVELTLPLKGTPAEARGSATGHDDFEHRPKPKVVL